jgi:hypothetical protein
MCEGDLGSRPAAVNRSRGVVAGRVLPWRHRRRSVAEGAGLPAQREKRVQSIRRVDGSRGRVRPLDSKEGVEVEGLGCAARMARLQRVPQRVEPGLALLEQPAAGAHHLARRGVAAGGDLGLYEAEEEGPRVMEGRLVLSGHATPQPVCPMEPQHKFTIKLSFCGLLFMHVVIPAPREADS